jgi:U1 small nuclear ribonucleoprotein 70kDa
MNKSGLPPSILSLFSPRPPVPYLPPIQKKELSSYEGCSSYTDKFEEESETKDWVPPERKYVIIERKKKEKEERKKRNFEELLSKWDPHKDEKIKGDPNNTIFVGHLDSSITEEDLKKKFEEYGNVTRVRVVKNEKKKKDFIYGFIEFEKHKDFKLAYQNANGKRVGKGTIIVDYERGRTIRNWKPKRLGEGLGLMKPMIKKMYHFF